jgi:hypothetical protein
LVHVQAAVLISAVADDQLRDKGVVAISFASPRKTPVRGQVKGRLVRVQVQIKVQVHIQVQVHM